MTSASVRRAAASLALACLLAGASAAEAIAGDGRIVTERRSASAFSSIGFGGAGTLRVRRGAQKVELSCDSNILPYITTEVESGELKIGVKPFASISPTRLQIDVSLPELAGLRLSGSGDAAVDPFKGESFSAKLSGSGSLRASLEYGSVLLDQSGSGGIDASVKAARLELRISGSGDAALRGAADRVDIVVSGSAEVGARELASQTARVIVSGSSRIELRAAKSLDVALSGSGDLRYWGDPALTQRVSGSGRVTKAGK
jgi:hypothetical protein